MSNSLQALPHNPREWHVRVWTLAAPIIFSNLSVPLVGVVDTAVLGHLSDPVYIGAVAIGAIIFNFVFWGFGFLRMGVTGFIAQAYGADNGTEIRAIIARATLLAPLLGFALILLQLPIISLALLGFDTSSTLENHVRVYFDIRIWAAPATLINYAVLGCLIGLQNTKAVLIAQLFLNFINILLDFIFVVGLNMGVEGVASATVIAEYSAAALGLWLMRKQLAAVAGRFEGKAMFHLPKMLAMLKANGNILLRTLCLIAAFYLFTARGTQLGESILAANAVLIHLLHIIAYGLDGFAHAAETLVGSAVGARDRHSLRKAVRLTSIWAGIVATVFAIVYAILGESLIALITDIESVRTNANTYLPWLIIAPLISVWSYQLDGIFIGATHTAEMRNAMAASLLFFILTAWALAELWGNHGLWLALILFNAFRAISLALYYPRIAKHLV